MQRRLSALMKVHGHGETWQAVKSTDVSLIIGSHMKSPALPKGWLRGPAAPSELVVPL